ncbi:hypothetical protein GH733_012167, partial [Mirounga leonina]
MYLNEEEIGRAIRKKIADGMVKREDIFYTSKTAWLGPNIALYNLSFFSVSQPGEELFPKDKDGEIIFDTVDFCATWEAMEKCKDLGLTKSIGVSNFSCRQLEMILNKPGLKYKPVCNQVECHPYLNQSKLLEFCKSKDIVLTAYAALGSDSRKEWVNKNTPVLLKDPVLKAIAEKHRCTPAQVALHFQLQRGVVALAKSFNEKRIRENFQVFDFQLTPEDMETLDGLNKNIRYFTDMRDGAIPRRGQAPHLRGAGAGVTPVGSGAGVTPAGSQGRSHTCGEPEQASHLWGPGAGVTPAGSGAGVTPAGSQSRRHTCGEPGQGSRLRGAGAGVTPSRCLAGTPGLPGERSSLRSWVNKQGPAAWSPPPPVGSPASPSQPAPPMSVRGRKRTPAASPELARALFTPASTTPTRGRPPSPDDPSGRASNPQAGERRPLPPEPRMRRRPPRTRFEILPRRRGLGSPLGSLPTHGQSAPSCFAERSRMCTVRQNLWAARAEPSGCRHRAHGVHASSTPA